ncbi:hydantoinase B/oxoprolinase family protein [Roseimaritima ulvae]|nr:hydantoinase B/oxoprolinase family protein [Roseimaritima ulvae]
MPDASQPLQVWADVGGTFTDCFVTDSQGRRSIKVLSSGVTKGMIAAVSTREGCTCLIDPRRSADAADFWTGFTLRVLDAGGGIVEQATVTAFTADDGGLLLDRLLPSVQADQTYELVSQLESPALAVRQLLGLPLNSPLPPLTARLGTTRGTNALLTRRGAAVTLLVTRGFADLLRIGEQDRPDLFALSIVKPPPLTEDVLEIDERLDARGSVLRPLDEDAVRQTLQTAYDRGARTLAISLLHAYQNDIHERAIERLAREIGFEDISRSSELAPLIKLVARTETTTLDAYLNPILNRYLSKVWEQLGGPGAAQLSWMTSGGSLVASEHFRGADSVLSGPAGGVVALAALANEHAITAGAIGLDMGGTSTDVSLYDGRLRRQFESRKAGLRMLTPMMAIETVAAGGGSVCSLEGQRLLVGPDSAGADPGPACYGRGGPLTVTDLNLVLGRIDAARFPFPLDRDAAVAQLQAIADRLPPGTLHGDAPPYLLLAEGFWKIAVGHMAEAVRTITTAEGVDPRPMTLVGFGGAAGQHLSAVAAALAMDRVFDHPDASLLSALGMGKADRGVTRTAGVYRLLGDVTEPLVNELQHTLLQQSCEALELPAGELSAGDAAEPSETFEPQNTSKTWTVDLRYQGTESTLELPLLPQQTLAERFSAEHQERFGYHHPQRPIEWVALRLEHRVRPHRVQPVEPLTETFQVTAEEHCPLFHEGRWQSAARVQREALRPGATITGPALITSDTSTLVVEPGWSATMQNDHSLDVRRQRQEFASPTVDPQTNEPTDAVLVEIVGRRLQGIADSMGEVLRRTAISVNVKERRDYSCAVFRGDGTLVANAPHVPVHLGAMGHTVRHLLKRFPQMTAGDCYVTNDPFAGGSHLPDVTVISPVFVDADATQPQFFVGSRAHHAEIGGITPGSMPPAATSLADEGVWIRDFALVREGVDHEAALRQMLSDGPHPSRAVEENLADIAAQRAAGHRGGKDLKELADKLGGAGVLDGCMQQLQRLSRSAVTQFATTLPAESRFEDELDDGSKICVTLTRTDRKAADAPHALSIDFAGTADVHPHGFNATPGIVTAAVLYVMRCAIDRPLPLNEGFMQAIDLKLPSGILNPPSDEDARRCPAVVAGNVETSQRVVDVLLGALGLAAASQGTMNNVLIGDDSFGYYETICGGSGATAQAAGADAVHTHMTNTRITDPEVLESRYPVRLWQFRIRQGSGGDGRWPGGNGVVRKWEFLRPLTLSLLTGRRQGHQPYGVAGGQPGKSGINWLQRSGRPPETLPACCTLSVKVGDRLIIETPGGAAWGTPSPP